MTKNIELSVERGLDKFNDDDFAIGLSIYLLKDDETMLDFKTKILKRLKKVGLKKIKIEDIGILVDGGYNG